MATLNVNAADLFALQRQKITLLNRGERSFKHDLQEITEGIQADRTAALLHSRELQLAAQLLLQAEASRIAAFAPGDLRVAAFARGAQGALDRAESLDTEASLASVRVPMVKKTEALLHGRITDERDRAAGPVIVTLVDARGAAVAGVGPVEADSAGYYALVVPADVAAALPTDSRFSVMLGHADQRRQSTLEPVQLAAGLIEFSNIQLNDKELEHLKLRVGIGGAAPTPVKPEKPDAPAKPPPRSSATPRHKSRG